MIWTIAWILWGLAAAAIEGNALISKRPGSTLSAHIWRWFRVRDPRPTALTWTLRAVLLAFMVWLTGHLAWGWWSL